MSDVTNIKTITNQLLYPVTVRNGENTQQTFTVNSSSGWNGDLWIPWVVSARDMWKSISLVWPTNKIYIFQHDNHIMYSWNNDFNQSGVLGGNSGIRGEKALVIESDSNIHM
ncbi:hypothetical protein NIES4073_77550 [Kalymmatonema gypsitolerans NIES-4073]|nr:hypothetical protein NIES4073_77550 [Scytonema sp. NIES-4073]